MSTELKQLSKPAFENMIYWVDNVLPTIPAQQLICVGDFLKIPTGFMRTASSRTGGVRFIKFTRFDELCRLKHDKIKEVADGSSFVDSAIKEIIKTCLMWVWHEQNYPSSDDSHNALDTLEALVNTPTW